MTLTQQIRQASQGMWADAGRPGGLERNELQASIIEAEILTAIEKDPVSASGSWIGGLHLTRFWFLLSNDDFAISLREHGKHVLSIEGPNGVLSPEKIAEMNRFVDNPKSEIDRLANPYPYRFQLKDVLLESREILMQLVADEYFMDGIESTPFTPEAFLPSPGMVNPFETYIRPNVTVETNGQIYNEGGAITPKPTEGFREIA